MKEMQHKVGRRILFIKALPKASIYTLGNITVSKVEEVETVKIVND